MTSVLIVFCSVLCGLFFLLACATLFAAGCEIVAACIEVVEAGLASLSETLNARRRRGTAPTGTTSSHKVEPGRHD